MPDGCGLAVSFVTGEGHVYIGVIRAVDLDWRPDRESPRWYREKYSRAVESPDILSYHPKVKYKTKYHRW